MTALRAQLAILDEKVNIPEARDLVEKIEAATRDTARLGAGLISLHDRAVDQGRAFDQQEHKDLLARFHEHSSTVRKLCVQLATMEIDLQNEKMKTATRDADQLKDTMWVLIICSSAFALLFGASLVVIIMRLRREMAQRAASQEELRQSQARIRALFDATSDSVALMSPDCGILDINHVGAQRRGQPARRLIGKQWCEGLDEYAVRRRKEKLAQVLDTARPVDFEEQRDDRYYAARMFPVADAQGQVHQVACFSRDITERKKAEEERKKLEAQLLQSQKMEAVGTLAGGIAHDFNNILAAILGFAEVAHKESLSGPVNPVNLRYIVASVHRAKELVLQILAFSRKQDPDLRPVDLNQIVRSTQRVLARTLPKMIDTETHLAPDLPAIRGDATQLEQVLLNLASNARDAMPKGGKLVVETALSVLDQEYCRQHLEVRPGAYVLLMVSDTGVGMDQATMSRVFEPFYTTKEVGEGTGLGLSTVYGIVKNHGGQVNCYSEVGAGTVFKIYLPLPAEGEAGQPAKAEPMDELTLTGTEKVLLVDDERHLRQLGEFNLKSLGYEVETATSGEQALAIYRARGEGIGLVIMDLGMPGMGGHEALKAILEINPQAKVLLASGYSADVQVKAALASGAAGYLPKPFSISQMSVMMRRILDA